MYMQPACRTRLSEFLIAIFPQPISILVVRGDIMITECLVLSLQRQTRHYVMGMHSQKSSKDVCLLYLGASTFTPIS